MLANVAVYAALAAAVWAYGPAIRFSWERFPAYLRGEIDASDQRQWEARAAEIIDERGDLDEARDLLEETLAVEPGGTTHYLLGEVDRAQGQVDEALRHYQQSCDLDPAQSAGWLRAAELLAARGDRAAAVRLLDRGARTLEGLLLRHDPIPDPSVDAEANEKALAVRSELAQDLESVRAALRGLQS